MVVLSAVAGGKLLCRRYGIKHKPIAIVSASGRNCIFITGTPGSHKGQWIPGVCEAKFPYICEKAGTKTKTTPTPPPGDYNLQNNLRLWKY